jgi:hypothetical protein
MQRWRRRVREVVLPFSGRSATGLTCVYRSSGSRKLNMLSTESHYEFLPVKTGSVLIVLLLLLGLLCGFSSSGRRCASPRLPQHR